MDTFFKKKTNLQKIRKQNKKIKRKKNKFEN